MNNDFSKVAAIVFDMDGTLYVSDAQEEAVWKSVSSYAGELLGCSAAEGKKHLQELRKQLTAQRGSLQTLAAIIREIGGTLQEMHRRFAAELEPAALIEPDNRVPGLIDRLTSSYRCWLLTNNNRILTDKILDVIGLTDSFENVIAIDDSWLPKPDAALVQNIITGLDLPAEAVLFVGDRYDIDLHLPAQAGCPTLLVKTVDELMRLEDLLTGKNL